MSTSSTVQQMETGPRERLAQIAQSIDDPRTLVPVIMLAALTIRIIVVCIFYRSLPDADLHYERFGWEVGWVARALASGHGFSSPYYPFSGLTALVPPLYTGLLAAVFRLFGVYSLKSGFVILSINSLFSTLTCIPVYFSAKYSLGPRAAKIACWAWALYPFAIYFSADRVWEYSLSVLLFTTCFCIAQRLHSYARPIAWLGFGALYGLAALSNPAVLVVLPFLLALAMLKVNQAGQPWLLKGTMTVAGTLLVIAPWTARNYRELHVICPVRDNFWLEFYAGNFGDTSDPNPPSAHPASNPVEMKKFLAQGETAYLLEKRALAIDYVRRHPLYFVQVSFRRIVYYWTGFWSFSHEYRQREPFQLPNIFFCGAVTLMMLRGARRLWREDRDAALPYLVLVLFFPLTYYVTHPWMDFRQPIEPAIVVLAIAAWLPESLAQSSRRLARVDAKADFAAP
jgi:4-amino-4-deoxy-L-arabinose transferase-like glycosyltransferase